MRIMSVSVGAILDIESAGGSSRAYLKNRQENDPRIELAGSGFSSKFKRLL